MRQATRILRISSASNSSLLKKVTKGFIGLAACMPAAMDDEPKEGSKALNPPPIGPRRGAKVKILKKESYWYNSIGSVVAGDQDPKAHYPVVFRFNKVNYANVSTNNYTIDGIEEIKRATRGQMHNMYIVL